MSDKGFGLKVFQLKHIIEQYIEETKKHIIYKSKPKEVLEEIIRKNGIDITKYKIIEKNPYAKTQDILKKAGIKRYTEEEQKTYYENLKHNERYKNPLLALNTYTNKEGKIEYLTPQEHQKKFIQQFIYSNLRGSIVFHGVGSGKTLTAVISSYYYLKLYPNNKVIVISPSALLFNFVAGMMQYGLDKNDNRYYFYTYEKYIRNPLLAKNSLLIIDEAHNFRTQLNINEIADPETKEIIGKDSSTNKRCMKTMQYGSDHCHKIILLTGTVFVNYLRDIENLLAMVDKREPSDYTQYDKILDNVENIKDYFDYKISYYPSSKSDANFPKRIDNFIPIYMSKDEEDKYNKIRNEGIPKSQGETPNAFYIAEKYASNMIGGKSNPKIEYVVNLLKEKPNQKFIIYCGLTSYGLNSISQRLDDEKIKHKEISGKLNSIQKEQSKLYFNYYDFNNKSFFDTKTISESNIKYINSEYRVLLISKAGAEGVDTVNCQNIILFDSQWNDALSEQIIARAIRFKSHIGLPEKERYVNVIKPVYCFETDKEIAEKIQKGDIDYVELKNSIKTSTTEQMKMMKGEDKRYDPSIKELKTYKNKNGNLFIPEKTEYRTIKGSWGRKSTQQQTTNDGWDKYLILDKPEKRKEWRINQYYNWIQYNKQDKTPKKSYRSHSVDLMLYIFAKSKQKVIDDFISHFGGGIKLFESYESKLIKEMNKKQIKLKRSLTENEKIELYKNIKESERNEILEVDTSYFMPKNLRNNKNKLQQFYTNEILAYYVYNYSSLKTSKNPMLKILEPTAGVGDLIKPILKQNKNINIDMVEIDPENRKKLNELVKVAPTYLNLCNQNNFLSFQTSTRYDYIFMNPPFHLRKSEDFNLLRDTWDYDFIRKAFALLKIGGELIAITSNKWKSNEEFKKWAKTNTKTFNFDDKPKEKFSGIVIDVSIMKFTKINDNEDNEILKIKYYITDNDKGKILNKNEISPDKIMNNYETEKSMKRETEAIENRPMKIFKDNLLL